MSSGDRVARVCRISFTIDTAASWPPVTSADPFFVFTIELSDLNRSTRLDRTMLVS